MLFLLSFSLIHLALELKDQELDQDPEKDVKLDQELKKGKEPDLDIDLDQSIELIELFVFNAIFINSPKPRPRNKPRKRLNPRSRPSPRPRYNPSPRLRIRQRPRIRPRIRHNRLSYHLHFFFSTSLLIIC